MSMMKRKRHPRTKSNLFFAAGVIGISILIAGCSQGSPSPAVETIVFKPPTAAPTATATNSPLPSPTPTPDEECTNQLQFEEDITVPDGTEFEPGEPIIKQWLVTNAGTCNWDQRYSVNLVSGPDLGAPRSQQLFPARNGQQVILEMHFAAPDDPGQYTSTWQAFDPQSQRFGDPFFIDIQITED